MNRLPLCMSAHGLPLAGRVICLIGCIPCAGVAVMSVVLIAREALGLR